MRRDLSSTSEVGEAHIILGGGWQRVPSWYEMGLEYYMRGSDPEKVIEYMSRALESKPCNYYAYYYLASSLKKLGRHEKALAVIKERIKRDREDSFNYFFGSIICVDIYYSTQGLKSIRAIEEAKKLIDLALMLTPSDIVYESHKQRIEGLIEGDGSNSFTFYRYSGGV